MQNKYVPLLADFDTYEKTLPVRRDIESGEDVRLCELPYWVIDKDLERMANDLERRAPTPSRTVVKYTAAPRSSGKTASALPAFLASALKYEDSSFTHYLYMAFDNNGENNFEIKDEMKLAGSKEKAQKQGSAFALECLKHLSEAGTGKRN